MKVAIVAFNNIRISPYVKTYSNWLEEKGIDYDLIYLNRSGEQEQLGSCTYSIPFNPKRGKFMNFLRFGKEVKKILTKNKYGFVFVMPTFPAVILSSFLKKKYKGKYVVDIRDRTYEDNKFYFKREKCAVENSAMNVISSKGYTSFLPEAKYVFCPNISASSRTPKYKFKRREGGVISIAYVGCIARVGLYKRLIEKVLSDGRFAVDLYGSEVTPGAISEYVKELGSDRVRYHGAFKPEEKAEIVKSVDILINIYGTLGMKRAMANKLYDAMYFKKPLISEADSLMYEECEGHSFAFDIEDERVLDKLYDWYMNIDGEAFDKFADDYIERTYAELDEFYAELERAVLG